MLKITIMRVDAACWRLTVTKGYEIICVALDFDTFDGACAHAGRIAKEG